MNETPEHSPRIVLLLAGGGARRMGGRDKGALDLAGRRLVDHVLARLAPQADLILISGDHDYGTGHTVLPDRDGGPLGPAAGLWAALSFIEAKFNSAVGFFTAPIDGPFLPDDLVLKLLRSGASSIAVSENSLHPTYAYWRLNRLKAALKGAPAGTGLALKDLAEQVGAKHVAFENSRAFFNVNTPDDLVRAEKLLRD